MRFSKEQLELAIHELKEFAVQALKDEMGDPEILDTPAKFISSCAQAMEDYEETKS